MEESVTIEGSSFYAKIPGIRKMRALLQQRFQSLGVKHAVDIETSNRLQETYQSLDDNLRIFSHSPDLKNLNALAEKLSALFMLKGLLVTKDSYGDSQHFTWSVVNGAVDKWCNENTDDTEFTFSLRFDADSCREEWISTNKTILGWYLLPYFVDIHSLVSVFLEIPEKVTFKSTQSRIKNPRQLDTDYDRIASIEDSPFLSNMKERILKTTDPLPDPTGNYVSMFNRIIDVAVYPFIETTSHAISCKVISEKILCEFSDALLSIPVYYSTGTMRHWTPWSFNFIECIRVAYKFSTKVYVPEPGQISFKSHEHKRMATYAMISAIIPEMYQWHLGILTSWKNRYMTDAQNLNLVREWRAAVHG